MKKLKAKWHTKLTKLINSNRLFFTVGVLLLLIGIGAAAFSSTKDSSILTVGKESPNEADTQLATKEIPRPASTDSQQSAPVQSPTTTTNKKPASTPGQSQSSSLYTGQNRTPLSATLEPTSVHFSDVDQGVNTVVVDLTANNPIGSVSFSGYDTSQVSVEVTGSNGPTGKMLYVKYLGSSVTSAGSTNVTIKVTESNSFEPQTVTLQLPVSWEP